MEQREGSSLRAVIPVFEFIAFEDNVAAKRAGGRTRTALCLRYSAPGGGAREVFDNVPHWAWALTMGAEYGAGGSLLNAGREAQQFNGDWRNTWSEVSIGNRGAALGAHFRVLGLTDVTRAWNFFMLDRWF